jgi:lipid-A-disaccharide synthase
MHLHRHIDEVSYMGFWEVFKNLKNIYNLINECKDDILQFSPDLVLLVDYPGFNLRIAEFAHKNKITTYYYISPKIWAWKKSRINKIRKYVNRMFVIFPFEQEYYKDFNLNVEYLGNPVFEDINGKKFNFDYNKKPVISLFPGSREQEVSLVLPVMLEVVKFFPDYNFVISATNSFNIDFYNAYIDKYENVDLIYGKSLEILSGSKAALVTSGTATLETALMNVPQIVCYKTSNLSYLIAKYLVKIKYISLVNILLNKESVVELIQSKLTVDNLRQNLDRILKDENIKEIKSDYKTLKSLLSTKQKVSEAIAKEIFSIKNS